MQDTMSSGGQPQHWRPTPTDPRGIAAHAWFDQADRLDLATLPPEDLRRLLAEAMEHVRQLLESSDEADRYELAHEQPGTHLTTDGEAAVIRGEDLLTVIGALADGAAWAEDTGHRDRAEEYRRISREIEEGE